MLAPGRCPASREGVSPQAVLPNGLSNGPGTGGEMEEEMGTLLGCTPLGNAVSNGGVLGAAGSLEGMGWARRLMFSDLPLLDQPAKGLRTQRGFAEACWGTTCQPGS